MFEVTMLGTASAVPTTQRGLSAIAVRRDGDVFLLDCGEGTQRQMMRFGVSYMKVKAIFITHLHLDHFLGVFGLVETMALNGRKEKLTLYGPRGSSAVFSRKEFLEIIEIDAKFSQQFDGFTASAFPTGHTKDSLGFVFSEETRRRFYEDKAKGLGIKGPMFSQIMDKGSLKIAGKTIKLKDVTYEQEGKKLAYTGDAVASAAIAKAAKGADLLIHEATFCEDRHEEAKEAKHSTALQAAQIAKKAGAKKLLLTHISGRYLGSQQLLDEAKKAFENTLIAEDGMKIGI